MHKEPASPSLAGGSSPDLRTSPTLLKPQGRSGARWGGHASPRISGSTAPAAPAAGYVTIPVAAAMTGYTAKAIRRKIEAGVWLEGREFRRAPDSLRISAIVDACFRLIVDGVSGHRGRAGDARKRGGSM